ncbi:MAG: ethylbenzene dehydrogenase-related protein [Magnetococcus sp. YQC-3]
MTSRDSFLGGLCGVIIGLSVWPGWTASATVHENWSVPPLAHPITVDGKLEDWAAAGRGAAWTLPLTDSDWQLGAEESGVAARQEEERWLRIWMGHRDGRLYMVAQWPDKTQNALYRPWKLSQGQYVRANTVDDMFVVRFQLGDSFNRCMLTNSPYRTDVWRWSAGRSNLAGIADDMSHAFSDRPFDQPAREYEGNTGLVYFLNRLDEGYPGWQSVPQPAPGTDAVVPGIAKAGQPTGSRADVAAAGVWENGVWTLEMARAFATGDPGDVVFVAEGEQVAQFAVFYAGYRLRKFVTAPVLLKFSSKQGGE